MTLTERDQVADLMAMVGDLTPWEQDFVRALARRDAQQPLTPNQDAKL